MDPFLREIPMRNLLAPMRVNLVGMWLDNEWLLIKLAVLPTIIKCYIIHHHGDHTHVLAPVVALQLRSLPLQLVHVKSLL